MDSESKITEVVLFTNRVFMVTGEDGAQVSTVQKDINGKKAERNFPQHRPMGQLVFQYLFHALESVSKSNNLRYKYLPISPVWKDLP